LTEGSIISDGCVVNDGAKIVDSVIGPCTVIAKNVELDGAVIVGRDEIMKRTQAEQDIGEGTVIRRCIVDSDAVIGANVRILNEAGVQNIDRSEDGYVISDGIVTILGGATIPDGFII
jgi:glucose-1-phosphate adenylyltransferase